MDEEYSDMSGSDASYYSDQDDDLDIVGVISPKKIKPDDENPENCEILTTEDVFSQMEATVKETSAIIELSPTITRHLLNSLGCNKDKLCDIIYEPKRREELFAKLNIKDPSTSKKKVLRRMNIDCQICYIQVPRSDCFAADCGHYFCKPCWDAYLKNHIVDVGLSSLITCPQQCTVVVNDTSVETLIVEPEIKAFFKKRILEDYIQCNGRMCQCPQPDCGNVILVKESGMQVVRCKCDFEFCFQCTVDWHSPVKCDLLKKWEKKNKDDSETVKWLVVNTKDCPRCGAAIEKNGGCNHMVCRKGNCQTQFCWICLTLWEEHSQNHYTCSVYKKGGEKTNKAPEEMKAYKEALERYHFYFTRYGTHRQSFQFENKLKTEIQNVTALLRRKAIWVDSQFLDTAMLVLHRCRKTLMHTYVFSFYLERNNEAAIFEANQENLQTSVEMLSKLLEDFKKMHEDEDGEEEPKQPEQIQEEVQKHITQIQNKYRYCETRREVLENHVKEGYKADIWQFLDL